MDNNKNTFIAIALLIGVWMVFNILFPQTQPPVEPAKQEQTETVAQEQVEPVAIKSPVVVPVVPVAEQEFTVRTDLYTAVLTNIGARIKHFELNNYRVSNNSEADLVSITDVSRTEHATLRAAGINGFLLSPEAAYNVNLSGSELTLSGDEKKEVVFSTRTPDGLIVEKVLTLSGNSYTFDLDLRVTNPGAAVARGSVELSLVQVIHEAAETDNFTFTGGSALVADEIQQNTHDDLDDGSVTYGKSTKWTAYEDKYFMSALVPLDNAAEKIVIQKVDNRVENVLTLPFMTLVPGATQNFKFMTYIGPRDKSILEAANHDLARAIDFGFFRIIADPLLWFLNEIFTFTHNYGIAIILLTVLIKILFWPLTHKSYASMKAMQKLQPEMQKIRERFKNDRARQGQETMELYKKHRVNPMSGCLPMLIQIPVFFALYRVLYQAIELRHADFAFWITDLSAKDPYYITPLIMGATMFIQQKMTPSTMDPTQQKIFLMMPVIFTVLFLNFPAGLVIYWLVNNVLTIVQQYYIHRKFA